MEIPVQGIRITMKHVAVCLVFPPADHGEKTVFLDDAQNGFRIVMHAIPFQPDRHPAIAVCAFIAFLTHAYQPCKFFILRLSFQAAHEVIVPTP